MMGESTAIIPTMQVYMVLPSGLTLSIANRMDTRSDKQLEEPFEC
jgi:hypothetical protein